MYIRVLTREILNILQAKIVYLQKDAMLRYDGIKH